MKSFAAVALSLFVCASALLAAPVEEPAQLKTMSGTVYGTLLVPESKKPVTVVLLIAGSGPTDRNGNNRLAGENNSLKFLAEALASHGIASLRYDKRGIGESKSSGAQEKDFRFEMYVDDAAAWVAQLRHDHRFSKIVIAGHSEGALIGTIAAQRGAVAGLVSIAGVGRPADAVIKSQLEGKLPDTLLQISDRILASLKSGKTVDEVPDALLMLYRPSVQPYMISWLRYDPAREIAKVKVPVLIVQGTTDIQVKVDDARMLLAAKKDAQMKIVDGMNHVLKMVDADKKNQIASYSDPKLPVAPALIDAVTAFVKSLK